MARYIDAEKIEYDKHKRIGLGIDYGINESDAYYTTTKEKIDAIPTADVRENVHARWLREPNCFYRCSECGKHYPSICDNMDFRFCPNCGAEME